jgi:hypothetical protein
MVFVYVIARYLVLWGAQVAILCRVGAVGLEVIERCLQWGRRSYLFESIMPQ